MRKKKINIPLYGGKLIIHQSNNFKKLEKKYNLTDTSGCDALAFQLNKKNGCGRFFMLFEKNITPSIIAHECNHIVNLIFKHCYVDLDLENDEAQSYLLGWLVKQCHKFLKIK